MPLVASIDITPERLRPGIPFGSYFLFDPWRSSARNGPAAVRPTCNNQDSVRLSIQYTPRCQRRGQESTA
ncbi:hypothetical protein DPEC_G00183910 [Dallia pectoralis]|uniref:Uncharacterized protein n=1 Tax=Dallia pectoralis TaxID=75939 RepID=A0ACC2GAY8_DALPE|nr:hypothetical protein DPEC_G00183910 [Dallia pectoralis]